VENKVSQANLVHKVRLVLWDQLDQTVPLANQDLLDNVANAVSQDCLGQWDPEVNLAHKVHRAHPDSLAPRDREATKEYKDSKESEEKLVCKERQE